MTSGPWSRVGLRLARVALHLVVLLLAVSGTVAVGAVPAAAAPLFAYDGSDADIGGPDGRTVVGSDDMSASDRGPEARAFRGARLAGSGTTSSPISVAPQRLGDLTPDEVSRIQSVVNQAGRPLEVAGFAASGTRRGVGTSLPIGKGPGTRSDIDYLVPPGSLDNYRGLTEGLPALDPGSGVIPGTHNPHIGPAIRFEPDADPYFVPGATE